MVSSEDNVRLFIRKKYIHSINAFTSIDEELRQAEVKHSGIGGGVSSLGVMGVNVSIGAIYYVSS